MNNLDWVVAVNVEFADGIWEAGTGYPIAPGVIMTARHILHPKKRGNPKSINVVWYYQKDKAQNEGMGESQKRFSDPKAKEIPIEYNHQEIDVALIACCFPDGVPQYAFLENNSPRELKWHGKGFPRVVKNGKKRNPLSLGGVAEKIADSDLELQLTNRIATVSPESWKGVSGAAVFDEQERIIGIITRCPDTKEGESLDAKLFFGIPSWRILENRSIRERIDQTCYDDRLEVVARVASDLASMLAMSHVAEKAIAETLGVNNDTGKSNQEVCKLIAMKLANEAPDSCIEHLWNIYAGSLNKGGGEVAVAIGQASLICLPLFVCQAELVVNLRKHLERTGAPIGKVPFRLPMAYEGLMASAERKAPEFIVSGGAPVSPWDLGTLAETGLDEDGSQADKQVAQVVSGVTQLSVDRKLLQTVSHPVYDKAKSFQGATVPDQGASTPLIADICDALEQIRDITERRFYFRLDQDGVGEKPDISLLNRIGEQYKPIAFLLHEGLADKENRHIGRLAKMIYYWLESRGKGAEG